MSVRFLRAAGLVLCIGPLSLASKFCFDDVIDYPHLEPRLVAALRQRLAETDFAQQQIPESTVVAALRGACIVWIKPSSPDGGNEAYFSRQYSRAGKIVYLYNGRTYSNLPVARVIVQRYMSRFASAFGRKQQITPLFIAAAGSDCLDEDLNLITLPKGVHDQTGGNSAESTDYAN